jgi:rubrerythrin
MSLSIDRLSASFAQLWRAVGDGQDERQPYVCRGCETPFDVQYHVCPVCGGFSVEPVPWEYGRESGPLQS